MKFQPKYNKAVISVLLMMNIFGLYSQSGVNYRYIDSLSYARYLEKDWDGVIQTAKLANKNQVDYFYLRLRTGIAFFEKQNYLHAEKEFKKAEKHNSLDILNKEYLYYSSLYSGKKYSSYRYYISNKSLLRERIQRNNEIISSVNLSGIYYFTLEKDPVSDINTSLIGEASGSQIITKDFSFGSLFLNHNLTKNLSLNHGGSYLNKNAYYFYSGSGLNYEAEIINIKQYQYYAGLNFNTRFDLDLKASFHFINSRFPSITINENSSGNQFQINGKNENYYSTRISMNKYFWLLNLDAGTSLSNLNRKRQFQNDFCLVFYPLGNLNLYALTKVYLLEEEMNSIYKNYTSFLFKAGIKTMNKLWLEAEAQTGEISNYNDLNGIAIYNSNEIQTLRLKLNLIIPGDKIDIYFITSYNEFYTQFTEYENISNQDFGKLELSGFSIIGEIKYNF